MHQHDSEKRYIYMAFGFGHFAYLGDGIVGKLEAEASLVNSITITFDYVIDTLLNADSKK